MASKRRRYFKEHPFAKFIGFHVASRGTYVARLVDIGDEENYQRQNNQRTGRDRVDTTAFLFKFRDATGSYNVVATYRMNVHGHDWCSLNKFLTALLGHPPRRGWDYHELIGTTCLITVKHKPTRDLCRIYAVVEAVMPAPEIPDVKRVIESDAKAGPIEPEEFKPVFEDLFALPVGMLV